MSGERHQEDGVGGWSLSLGFLPPSVPGPAGAPGLSDWVQFGHIITRA